MFLSSLRLTFIHAYLQLPLGQEYLMDLSFFISETATATDTVSLPIPLSLSWLLGLSKPHMHLAFPCWRPASQHWVTLSSLPTWAQFMTNSYQLTCLLFLELTLDSLFSAKIKPGNSSNKAESVWLMQDDLWSKYSTDLHVGQTDIPGWEPRQGYKLCRGEKKKHIWVNQKQKESARFGNKIDSGEEESGRNNSQTCTRYYMFSPCLYERCSREILFTETKGETFFKKLR